MAILHYYSPPKDGSEPTFLVTHESGAGTKNYDHHEVLTVIRDMRHREKAFSLERHSFAAVSRSPPSDVEYASSENVKERYSQDAVQILLQHATGSRKVVVFDNTIRRASLQEVLCRPVRKVHIDQTPWAVSRRVRQHLTRPEADAVMNGSIRVRLINVWRPLLQTVVDHPLAVAESGSLEDKDLIKVKHIYPHLTGETFAVKHNPRQRFWYWSQMSSHEALLLQCYDSKMQPDESEQLWDVRCAHASFTPLPAPLQRHGRQSIETRCLVLD
ncbi:MAG: hypothetical protein Q9164_004455 [Protoblastenia rupestris]